jgi:hypothetical protein
MPEVSEVVSHIQRPFHKERTHLTSFTSLGFSDVEGDEQSRLIGSGRSSSESWRPSDRRGCFLPGVLLWRGSNVILFCRSRCSYLRIRSRSSRSGNRRFRCRGFSAAGTHCALNLRQLAHGNFRSHFTLRCWQSTQASVRCNFEDREDAEGGPDDETFSESGGMVDMVCIAEDPCAIV